MKGAGYKKIIITNCPNTSTHENDNFHEERKVQLLLKIFPNYKRQTRKDLKMNQVPTVPCKSVIKNKDSRTSSWLTKQSTQIYEDNSNFFAHKYVSCVQKILKKKLKKDLTLWLTRAFP